MGREIRRVPPDWEHPRYTAENARRPNMIGQHIPLYDEDYETAAKKWIQEFRQWEDGVHPSQPSKYAHYFWEYDSPPDPESYRVRRWTLEEATHVQVYETVSEGTPVTPHFETEKELIDWLVLHGDAWDQARHEGGWNREAAERFVKRGSAPSLIVENLPTGVTIKRPRDQ